LVPTSVREIRNARRDPRDHGISDKRVLRHKPPTRFTKITDSPFPLKNGGEGHEAGRFGEERAIRKMDTDGDRRRPGGAVAVDAAGRGEYPRLIRARRGAA